MVLGSKRLTKDNGAVAVGTGVVVATSATSEACELGPVLTICVVISSMKSCVATCTSCSSSMPSVMGTSSKAHHLSLSSYP
ncbi:hypothetical protein HAX54_039818 [Datura stramonium]|uniref:Uncharacterized protein n=1 Tax=Datura stramonium TaxID=4076 RepID=A0ABS8VLU1_DATST|nr:hypothetical protein [Datura stramonium]